MATETKQTTSGRGLAKVAKHLKRTSPGTAKAMTRYYERERERGGKIPRPASASHDVGATAGR
jgi:hypothetical protein